jgi:hypothetical protein
VLLAVLTEASEPEVAPSLRRARKPNRPGSGRLSVADFPAFPVQRTSFDSNVGVTVGQRVGEGGLLGGAVVHDLDHQLVRANEALELRAVQFNKAKKKRKKKKKKTKCSLHDISRALPNGVTIAHPEIEGWLDKKAQGYSTFGRSNWKKRWFTLHRGALRYYDHCAPGNTGTICKGIIETSQISTIELLADAFDRTCLIQVVHSAILYIQAADEPTAARWVAALRRTCCLNRVMHRRFHPAHYTGKKWVCCMAPSRDVAGCSPAFDYSAMQQAAADAAKIAGRVQPALSAPLATAVATAAAAGGTGVVAGGHGSARAPDQPPATAMAAALRGAGARTTASAVGEVGVTATQLPPPPATSPTKAVASAFSDEEEDCMCEHCGDEFEGRTALGAHVAAVHPAAAAGQRAGGGGGSGGGEAAGARREPRERAATTASTTSVFSIGCWVRRTLQWPDSNPREASQARSR